MIHIGLDFIRAYSPSEQLVMLYLLLHADENGNVDFCERNISRVTEVSYKTCRTIHQRFKSEGVIKGAPTGAVGGAVGEAVTICDFDSYSVLTKIRAHIGGAPKGALKEVEITKEKENVFPQTPFQGEIENNKDEDNIKEYDTNVSKKKEPETELEKQFEAFRRKYKEYGGSARGFSTEFENFKKKHKDWKEVIPMLEYAIDKEHELRVEAESRKVFFARMQNLKTYINQRSWEAYSDGYESYDPDAYHPEGFNYDAEFDAYRFCNYIPNHDLLDGYTDDTRPDGARIVEQITVWVWSREQRRWNKELKK